MKVLFDTSVLIAAMVEAHPLHSRALPWLKRAKDGAIEYVVASHTLAELYAVLTTLPLMPKIPPATAWRLVHDNVAQSARSVSLTPVEYKATIQQAAEMGIAGGAIYDALIAKVAQKARVQRLLTFNLEDFKRVWPDATTVLSAP